MEPLIAIAFSEICGDLPRKVAICDQVLAEANRLVELGRFDASLYQLISRACELLDEMDSLLLTLEPTKNARDFAMAATLHRELEFVQTAISNERRGVDDARANARRR